MPSKTDILRILKGERSYPPYFYPLLPAGWVYGAAVSVRSGLYGSSVLRTKKLPCRVVSVGNITAGGTGKTPMTVYIAGLLKDAGKRPAVLIRGYGGGAEGRTLVVSDGSGRNVGPEEAGDEACLIADRLEGVPVITGSDRYSAGMLAVERFGADVAVLDDGFQHIGLARDLDVVLLDAARPFGNGRVLPAGYLREPKSAINRANAVILTRADIAGEEAVAVSRRQLNEISPGLPVFEASHDPRDLFSMSEKRHFPLGHIAGMGVYGFCGLADPSSFTLILKQLSANITGFTGFDDHHRYTGGDLAVLEAAARKAGADVLVTTEKDAVKLTGLVPTEMRLLVLGVDMAIRSDEDGFRKLVLHSSD